MTEISILRNVSEAIELAEGEVLFREGEPGEMMFAIIEGELALTLNGRAIENVGPGSILGEMALIDSSTRSTTATAITDARVVPVDRQRFTYLVQEHPTFALQVMALMAERLRKANG